MARDTDRERPVAPSLKVAAARGPGTDARYFGWAPVSCELWGVDLPAGREVTISQETTARSGRLLFGTGESTESEITLRLPGGDEPARLTVAGEFERASTVEGDVLVVVSDQEGRRLATFPTMVRVRKDANELDTRERDRFLRAFAAINDQGRGVFRAFRDSHTNATSFQAHGDAAFLPWHRAFLLDLERELQRVDPSVALPYWRFDLPARRVFMADYIGAHEGTTGAVRFAPSNPLAQWTTDGVLGVERSPNFDTQRESAPGASELPLIQERQVVRFAGPFGQLPEPFELTPHGAAHVSFTGFLEDLDTAARDPLFYLLHCNVDRLWAKWQWINGRMNPADPDSFGSHQSRPPGHNLADTMWPWNGVTQPPRPNIAPRQPLVDGDGVGAPGPEPTVESMIDYQGLHDPRRRLGFDYDDVPYQP